MNIVCGFIMIVLKCENVKTELLSRFIIRFIMNVIQFDITGPFGLKYKAAERCFILIISIMPCMSTSHTMIQGQNDQHLGQRE